MKRTVEVATPGTHLKLQDDCLTICHDREIVGTVPLEDLGALILASPALTITSAVLGRLADLGGVTIVAGKDHQPEGALLPFRAHTSRGERIRAQIGAGEPLRKRMWAALVKSKITNQAALVPDSATAKLMLVTARRVRSGDPDNREARAARCYWPVVFSAMGPPFDREPFRRSRAGAWPNNFLNYGYAILRAMTARSICGAGLLPEVGLHHHSKYDPFALASDLMEPFRPWVDHRCQELIPGGPAELTRSSKEALLGIYDDPVSLGGESTPLYVAMERTAASLARAFSEAARGSRAQEAAKHLLLPCFPESP